MRLAHLAYHPEVWFAGKGACYSPSASWAAATPVRWPDLLCVAGDKDPGFTASVPDASVDGMSQLPCPMIRLHRGIRDMATRMSGTARGDTSVPSAAHLSRTIRRS